MGSKTVISESTSKITFPHGDLLDILSVKVPERKFQRDEPQNKKQQSSSTDGRAGSNTRPARRMAEVDRMSDQLGHPPRWISQVRRMAELDRTRDQLGGRAGPVQFGGWPGWIESATSSAIRRVGPVQFGGWPSWNDRVVLVLPARLLS